MTDTSTISTSRLVRMLDDLLGDLVEKEDAQEMYNITQAINRRARGQVDRFPYSRMHGGDFYTLAEQALVALNMGIEHRPKILEIADALLLPPEFRAEMQRFYDMVGKYYNRS